MWVVIHDDWLKDVGKYSPLHAWVYIMSTHKKGILKTSLGNLSKDWGWSKPSVSRFLTNLQEKGRIEYRPNPFGCEIEVVNYKDYPVASHQTPVVKKKKRLISEIKGKTPIPGLNIHENFAVFFYRNWIHKFPDNKKLKQADLDAWADPFRLMLTADSRDKNEMVEMARWVLEDEFWSQNILSPSGFRRNYDKVKPRFLQEKVDKKSTTSTSGKWQTNKIKKGEIL